MKTIISQINNDNFDDVINTAGNILRGGGLVAFPTETVYGLGGDGLNPKASADIYGAKGRPSDNPLIVHISDMHALSKLAADVPDEAYRLAEAFWPGPLTMILKKSDMVPYETTGGLDTVAIRMPSHPVAKELISRSGVYIAAPSANLSGRPSPTKAAHVIEDLNGRIDMIIDGGDIDIGIESTIVDLTVPVPMILRPGFITASMIKEVLGDVTYDKTVLSHSMTKDKPKAPGMKYRHYAPKADLTIVEGENDAVVKKINELVEKSTLEGKKAAVMASAENADLYDCDNVVVLGHRNNEKEIAAHLFDVLRSFDGMDVDEIYSEGFSEEEFGQAVMNRLIKAAGHKIVEV